MLGIHPAIIGGLGVCLILLIYTLWEEQVIRCVIRGGSGLLTMWIGNMVVPSVLVLEWNFLHILIAIILGIPGALGMFLFHYLRL